MHEKSLKGSCAKNTAILTILAILIVAVTLISTQTLQTTATVGSNHKIEIEYCRALAYDTHDPDDPGKWFSRLPIQQKSLA